MTPNVSFKLFEFGNYYGLGPYQVVKVTVPYYTVL
jgi:hypothetical protein